MSVQTSKHKNRNPARLGALLLSICALAVSCTRDLRDETPQQHLRSDEALVRLTVSTPRPALPKTLTRSTDPAADAENRISEVSILVFEDEGGRYIYRYKADGEQVQSTAGNTTQFQAKLTSSPKKMKLVLVGNPGDAFTDYAPLSGADEPTVRSGLVRSFAGMTGDLPMYGEIDLPSGLGGGSDNSFTAKMLRGMARVDVVKELAGDSQPFRMKEVYLFRANDRVQIIPNDIANPATPKVTAPSVPSGAAALAAPILTDPGELDPVSVTNIYVPEAAARSDAAGRLTGVTCIVVGGYYKDETQPSYYRIDFNPGLEGHPFGQVLRNHKYVFRITKVTGSGWSDPGTAATNKATSIIAQVEPWEDFTTEMYFEGENYLGVSSRRIVTAYPAGSGKVLDVQASVPYTIQWLDSSGNPVGNPVSGVGAALADNGDFTAAIRQDTGDSSDVTHIVFTARNDNRSAGDLTARLRIQGGRWTFDITVVQETSRKYAKRTVRVLSVTEIGDLGTSTPTTASGLAVRKILDNTANFSANGTVVIGGFAFVEASRAEMQATGTGSAADQGIFRGMQGLINAQDVIYLTYNTPISDELAKVVLAWLKGSTNRVLIVGTDTKSTNEKLMPYLSGDGTWMYYSQNNIGGAFKRAAQTDDNAVFFNRPFGQIPENALITRADDAAGYNYTYPPAVTPLIVSDKSGYENYMILGVNKSARIVYQGDANLHQYSRMSSQANTDGTVTNDLDRLTANLWAWIVGQVCQGT